MFGQEFGRVLSDGRIVGRAEPFAKVFPSSRAVKRAVGLTAWAILEDIALDAIIDTEGRLVAETNVRRIADNLGLNKDTVTRHLGRLRQHGFVLHEELRADKSGRYETARYILDPSACIERFTVTPLGKLASEATMGTGPQLRDDEPCPKMSDTVRQGAATSSAVPCPNRSDAVPPDAATSPPVPVSEVTGHGGSGRQQQEEVGVQEEQQRLRPAALVKGLVDLGLTERRAWSLVDRHPARQVRDALDAATTQRPRNPGGWVVAALRDGWDLTGLTGTSPRGRDEDRTLRHDSDRDEGHQPRRSRQDETERLRSEGWAAAIAACLDDQQLTAALEHVMGSMPSMARHSVHVARAQLVGWAAAAHAGQPDQPLQEALRLALSTSARVPPIGDELPRPPRVPASTAAAPLDDRLAAYLRGRAASSARV